MQLTDEQIEKIALDFVKKPGMHGYIEVGDLIDFASALRAAHSSGAQGNWKLSDDDLDKVDEQARASFRRHQHSVRGQQLSAADSFDCHIAWATAALLRDRFSAQPQPTTDAVRDVLTEQRCLTNVELGELRLLIAFCESYLVAPYIDRGSDVDNAMRALRKRIAEIERLERAKGE